MKLNTQIVPVVINLIYTLLVQYVGAPESGRDNFIVTEAMEWDRSGIMLPEYRFQGSLGFGGKFRCRHSSPLEQIRTGIPESWYVDYYSEDKNDEREKQVQQINEMLENLQISLIDWGNFFIYPEYTLNEQINGRTKI